MTILQFPTKNICKSKDVYKTLKVRFQTETLEDGSVWWRVEDIKTGEYGEWVKLEDEG